MRISTRYAAVALAVGAVLTGCSSEAGEAANDAAENTVAVETDATFAAGTTMARIADAGELRVGTKIDQPGFGLANAEGTPEGFDVEMAKIIAAKLGLSEDQIVFQETVSANREPFIQNDQVDIVVATYTINDKRKEIVDFAGPYYVAGQDIMVAKGNPEGITGPDDLAGKTVCSVEGSTPAENIRTNYPQAQLVLYDVYSKCADDLRNGNVQAVTTDNVILTGLVAGSPDQLELVGAPFTEEPYGIGLKKGDDDFRTFINDTLEESFEDGSWEQAWDSTAGAITGEPAPATPTIDRY
ncbi:transporter substrate-binding domain-containing protein [Modestobacter sp. I12A-02628]|uniref:Glutamate ABC transporter substrate-binding protein n=1 Tax=Goekera deserti TaxID=2497753 RepID=A0A7K3WI32_9ACTN|nr:glutamate ABC transporter substrate-binding protein [Goekera deserti]MPQ96363.1 transporter substrate-binding domain-containing protein [Goekera deserti]NDI50531.1 transporter substrate-binding domain-containing protein [Goekera deserti]NEL56155.1 glutamate ABC transporter substrate-binding protein [Goekera deserti]